LPVTNKVANVIGCVGDSSGYLLGGFGAPVHFCGLDADQRPVRGQVIAQAESIENIGQAKFVNAAMVVTQVCIHVLALQHGDRARWLAETHGVHGDEPIEIGQPVHHRQTDSSGVETLDVLTGMVGLVMTERMYTGAVVLEQVVTYPHHRDGIHADAPDVITYQPKLIHALQCAYTGLYRHPWQEIARVTRIPILIILVFAGATGTTACAEPAESCPPRDGVAVQVLGSGGPIADDNRASSGYILWVDGQSSALIDAGGGTFLRFGEAGADFTQLDFVGLSHFHTDHSADFPALLKSGYFSPRKRPLAVAGPGAGGPFPGLAAYLDSLLQSESGAYGYLSGYLDGSGGLVKLELHEIAREQETPVRVFGEDNADVTVDALPVPHGIVPALGFRVRVSDVTIVFASDQNGTDPAFADFADGATALVMHMPIPVGATGGALQLHALPGRIGEIASETSAGTLILSHFMARSLRTLETNVSAVAANYDGRIIVANDLDCVVLTD